MTPKIIRRLIALFLTIIALNFVFIYGFKEWHFTKPVFYNLFWAIHFCSIASSMILFLILKNPNLKIGLSLFLVLVWVILFYGQFNPIDTYEYPHDIKVISENGNEKRIITQAKSGKTNEIKRDTITVIDRGIFRKRIEKG